MFNNEYKNKKVIVTGHTGFKGSWLCRWLQIMGANVIGISLQPNTQPSHFNLLNLDIESYFIDIRNAEEIEKTIKKIKPDIVFHLAAQPLVRDSYDIPLITFETNVIGTANILNACRNMDDLRGVVIVTTDKCYENKEWIWGYRESDPVGGHDPYSASKGCAELVTSCFRKSFFNLELYGKSHGTLIASARAGNVIGGGDWSKDRLIPDIMRAVSKGEAVTIRNPESTRPWQHVLECLSGYLCLGEKLLQRDKKFAESWNFASTFEENAKVLEIVNLIKKYWNKLQYEVKTQENQPYEAGLLRLDCSKALTHLCWKNVWNLENTIAATTNWYRNFYENNAISTDLDIENYIKDAKRVGVRWATEN